MRLIDADRLYDERPEFLNPVREGREEYNKGWNACIEMFCELIDAQPTVKNEYAWHDLRKNPEDLPKNGGKVLVYENQHNEFFKFNTYIAYAEVKEYYDNQYVIHTPIAWREIEPFEEVGE